MAIIPVKKLKRGNRLVYQGEVFRVESVRYKNNKYIVKIVGARVPLEIPWDANVKVQ